MYIFVTYNYHTTYRLLMIPYVIYMFSVLRICRCRSVTPPTIPRQGMVQLTGLVTILVLMLSIGQVQSCLCTGSKRHGKREVCHRNGRWYYAFMGASICVMIVHIACIWLYYFIISWYFTVSFWLQSQFLFHMILLLHFKIILISL